MKFLRVVCIGLALCCATVSSVTMAHTLLDSDAANPIIWIQRMNKAAKTSNYSGVMTYKSRSYTDTSSVNHFVDALGEHEQFTYPGGSSREVIRNNNDVTIYLPQQHLVIFDRSGVAIGRLPWLDFFTPSLTSVYSLKMGGIEQVAGRKTQKLTLVARDPLRYSRDLLLDTQTGLLLKATIFDENNTEVEEVFFDKINTEPKHKSMSVDMLHELPPRGWAIVDLRGHEISQKDLKWELHDLPPGFRAVSAFSRPIRQNGPDICHIVVTDGVTVISVFVESLRAQVPEEGTASLGLYRRILGRDQITTLGDAPMATLKRVAEGVQERSTSKN